MAERIGGSVTYDVPATEENIRAVLGAIRDSVRANWAADRTGLGVEYPRLLIDPEGWPSRGVLRPFDSPNPIADGDQIDWLLFSFSPVSQYLCDLFIRDKAGRFAVDFDCYRSVRDEVEGSLELLQTEEEDRRREEAIESALASGGYDPDINNQWDEILDRRAALRDTPSAWPQNRDCLLCIYEGMKAVLPVRDEHIDETIFCRMR